jgi:hypothetical protein
MRESSIPGPVRVALAVDGGIAAVYGTAAVVGVPDGRLGTVVVGGEAAVWAAVVLAWVFPAFWSRWSGAVERLTGVAWATAEDVPVKPLAPWPSIRSQVFGATGLTLLLVVQALTTSGAGVPFRSVVAAYVVAAALGSALLAIIADVSSLLGATRIDD